MKKLRAPSLGVPRTVHATRWELLLAQTPGRKEPKLLADSKSGFPLKEVTFEKSMNFCNNKPTDLCLRTDTGYSWYYVRELHVIWEQGRCGHCRLKPIFSPKNTNGRRYPILQWEIFKTSRTHSWLIITKWPLRWEECPSLPLLTSFLLPSFQIQREGNIFCRMSCCLRDSSIQT